MPRFLGRSKRSVYWNVVALIVLAIVVFLVLELTGTIDLLSFLPTPLFA
jgi:uncharacterized membrane protein YhaH (DUF805 family)